MEDIKSDWEIKIDASRKKHKHNVATGNLKKASAIGVKYCYDCDVFYYKHKKMK